MCGCRGRGVNMVGHTIDINLTKPNELALVITSTPEPIYGCITGTRYPFDEQGTLYVDIRDLECMPLGYTAI